MVYKYESSHESTEMPRKLGRSHLPDCAAFRAWKMHLGVVRFMAQASTHTY